MRIFVNGSPVDLLPGMTVRHALIQLGLLHHKRGPFLRIEDRWGNLVGLDGALEEGDEIFLAEVKETNSSPHYSE